MGLKLRVRLGVKVKIEDLRVRFQFNVSGWGFWIGDLVFS